MSPPMDMYREQVAGYSTNEPVRFIVSTQFIIKLAVAAFLIWAGIHYDRQCDKPLALWLWVIGVSWVLFVLITVLSFYASSNDAGATGAQAALIGCFPCILCFLCVIGPFMVVWFILGNFWVFTASNCDSTLYHIAFYYLIALYILAFLNCCCFTGDKFYRRADERTQPLLV